MLLHSNYNFGADKVADREWTIEKLLFRDQLVVSHWPGRVTLIFTWLVDVDADQEGDTPNQRVSKEKTKLLVGRHP